jgi:amino acid adenylation domain-containing protein
VRPASAKRLGAADTGAQMKELTNDHAGAQVEQSSRIDSSLGCGLLSFGEERLRWLQQFDPSSIAYNVKVALRFRRIVDGDALSAAVARLVDRHSALRTRYVLGDEGEPRRVVLAYDSVNVLFADVPAGRDWYSVADELLCHSFDLAAESPLRAAVLSDDNGNHILALVIHHIVIDGWSRRLIQRDIDALYREALGCSAEELPQVGADYADFVVRQRRSVDDQLLARQVEYWRAELADCAQLVLPLDGTRSPWNSGPCAQAELELPTELTSQLRSFALRQRCSPAAAVIAAFQALLARQSGQDDIVIGSALDGREEQEFAETVGFFVNTIVLRAQLSPETTFRQLVIHTNSRFLAAYQNQDAPFEQVVAAVRPERTAGRNALFDVAVVHHGESTERVAREDAFEREPWPHVPTAMDLEFNTWFRCGKLHCSLIYRSDLFRPETARQYLDRLALLLEAVLADPDAALAALDLLTPSERQALLSGWNGSDIPYPESPVDQIFENWVGAQPDAPAIVHGSLTSTYLQVDVEANRLARVLAQRGLGPARVAALILPRSQMMVTAILAALKAGGAYLPVDPQLPGHRIRRLITKSGAAVVVTCRESLPDLTGIDNLVILDDPELGTLLDQASAKPLNHSEQCAPTPDSAAYVIYTSGSTGEPKGVVVPHRGLVNLAEWMERNFGSKIFSRVLAAASFSFDMSVVETLIPLLKGGTVELATDFLELPRLARSRFGLVCGVPSAVEAVIDGSAELDSDLVLVGGEAYTPALAKLLRAVVDPGTVIMNGYGPTEATCFATAWVDDFRESGVMPIGRPVGNMRAYVLDDQLRLTPPGVTGELFLAGDGLALGYLKAPGFTAERFVANPFGRPGERMYRTGDLARWRFDGQLIFAGRVDAQVKIRGYRIELAEVEAVIAEHPEVAQCAVVVHEDDSAGPQLAAFIVLDAVAGLSRWDAAGLRAFVAERLPAYMVPSTHTRLDALPLSSSGKIDRRALPQPAQESGSSERPRSKQEAFLCEVFAEVLGKPQDIAPDADFFEVGGHSLLAIRLVGRIRDGLGAEITLRDIFQRRTPAALAAVLDDSVTLESR